MANKEITLNEILNASFCDAGCMKFNQEPQNQKPETKYVQTLKEVAYKIANATKIKSNEFYNQIKKCIRELEYNAGSITQDAREKELEKYYALVRD
ncbi:MAG: hypothetical protein WC755_02810 [Candidatus Woesearchaeota archaeon]|jgi:hypothetical protein